MLRSIVVLCWIASSAFAQEKPERLTVRIVGLFAPDREADLRTAFNDVPEVKLISIDYKLAEMTLEFTPKTAFPGAKPPQYVERLDQKVRSVSQSTFSVEAQRKLSREKLTEVLILAPGLDCKACSLAAYEAIAKLDGVERATVNFKEGKIRATIDPTKTDIAKLEEALRKKGVTIPKK